MAAVGSCGKCHADQVSAPCCRWGLLRRSRRLRRRGLDGGEEDHISRLPDDVLRLFLARLGCARAAAHTGLVSRRWSNLWATLPELTFHNTAPGQVEAALARVTRPSLSLLDIHVPKHHPVDPPGVASLLRSAARLAPAELKIALSGSAAAIQSRYRSPHPPYFYHVDPVEVELPCFDRATSISISISISTLIPVIRLVLPPAGDFLKLESLSLSSCDVGSIASLLPRCPSLRKLRIHSSRLISITGHSPSLEELDVSTQEVLQRIDIRAPLLKKLKIYATSCISKEFSLSYSAPKLEELFWSCGHDSSPDVGHSMWHLSSSMLETPTPLGDRQLAANDKETTCLQSSQHCPRFDMAELCIWLRGITEYDVPRSFRQLMSQLPVAKFSVLELDISTRGHSYGEVVLHLLMICSTAQRLKIELFAVEVEECSVDCNCDEPNNWRDQTFPMADLKEVEIQGFKGKAQEIDLLKVIFRSATMLERVAIELYYEVSPSDNRYMETLGILEAHPSVKSTISTSTIRSVF
ncbi:unnamed protein product [Urochloa decumbens]|uniref:F-box/LRR-repeat protein 15/At3g58940/PEG3-like LRR domain-containing protein n=1 Tax=Urochloa decumbens TaxID=240449 RepID=A0ABC9G2P7_9POAL